MRFLAGTGSDARYISTGHLVYALGDGLFAVVFDVDSLEVVGGPVSLVQGVARDGYGPTADGTPAGGIVQDVPPAS